MQFNKVTKAEHSIYFGNSALRHEEVLIEINLSRCSFPNPLAITSHEPDHSVLVFSIYPFSLPRC